MKIGPFIPFKMNTFWVQFQYFGKIYYDENCGMVETVQFKIFISELSKKINIFFFRLRFLPIFNKFKYNLGTQMK